MNVIILESSIGSFIDIWFVCVLSPKQTFEFTNSAEHSMRIVQYSVLVFQGFSQMHVIVRFGVLRNY